VENIEINKSGSPSSASKRRIVLCGSMSAYPEIKRLRDELYLKKVRCIIPEPEDEIKPSLSVEAFEDFKRRVSFSYLKQIRHPLTVAVLAVNLDKHGVRSYIGPNTFAEIAVAFAQRKRIYVYQNYPDIYRDELSAWKVIELFGDSRPLVENYLLSESEERQLKLF